jgi:hypothetical protein
MDIIIEGENYKNMDSLIQLQENEEENVVEGVPVRAANLVSPVTDTANSLDKFTT